MLDKLIIYKSTDKIYTLGYTKDGVLEYFLSEILQDPTHAIYLVKITYVNSHNRLAFVEYANNCSGVLNLDKHLKVQCGTLLLCQMTWPGDNEKQAKFSTSINLAGKYVVLLLNSSEHHLAKNLVKRNNIATLSQKYIAHGLIFRSAINYVDDLDLVTNEIEFLIKQQYLIEQAKAIRLTTPGCIWPGENKYLRLLKNLNYSNNVNISTNCENIFGQLKSYVDLWAIHELNLDTSLVVDLPVILNNQGSIDINVSGIGIKLHRLSGINLIDIDSNNTKLSFFKVNYLACEAIIRQIKLYDLTGIILIDFIKNMAIIEQQKIVTNLSDLLANDWRKSTVLGFTKAGICEIIRNK